MFLNCFFVNYVYWTDRTCSKDWPAVGGFWNRDSMCSSTSNRSSEEWQHWDYNPIWQWSSSTLASKATWNGFSSARYWWTLQPLWSSDQNIVRLPIWKRGESLVCPYWPIVLKTFSWKPIHTLVGLRIVPIQATFINLKIKNVVFKAGSKTIVISKSKVVTKDTHPPKKEKDSNEEDTSTWVITIPPNFTLVEQEVYGVSVC